MTFKPKYYNLTPAKGQALLNFQGRLKPSKMELFETEIVEVINQTKKEKNKIPTDASNLVIHGDCLSACAYLKSQNIKVDLVYIDPPFSSGANYAKKIFLRNGGLLKFNDVDNTIGEEVMYGDIWAKEDYLNWLYERLLAIREIMSETGNIFVHLSWHIGHYVKILLDEVFGEENFINEIIWYYPDNFQGNVNGFATNHNNIFWYSKTNKPQYNKVYVDLDKPKKRDKRIWSTEEQKLVAARNENGKIIYEEHTQKKLDDVWVIGQSSVTKSKSKEYLGYNTQKPKEILNRIITAASDENLVVADFFCGSGTAAEVAFKHNRNFIAVDVGINAIQTTRDRLIGIGASFNVLKIKDGLKLFRNPAQTTMRIFDLIEGFRFNKELNIGKFWDGGIADDNGSYIPVKFIGIHQRLTKELFDTILEEIYQLESIETIRAVKIVYAYKDLDIDQDYADNTINDSGKTTLKVGLLSLDRLLEQKKDLLYQPIDAKLSIEEVKDIEGAYVVKIEKYYSGYLKLKVDEYNAKKKNKNNIIKISSSGRELIEVVQFDTTLRRDGVWVSNLGLEDKASLTDAVKGEYVLNTINFKIKIRDICGDEIILSSKEIINK